MESNLSTDLSTAAIKANIEYYKNLTNRHLDMAELYLTQQIEYEIILATRSLDFTAN